MIINIKVSIKKLLEEHYQINPETTEQLFNEGILRENVCRDALIRDEYRRKARPKERQIVKTNIADRFCLSIDSIEKILRRDN